MELYHAPRFRSTRVIILYKELLQAYSSNPNADDNDACKNKKDIEESVKTQLPVLRVHTFHDTASFRSNKPEWYLKMNPNGKVPYFRDFLSNKNEGDTRSIIFTDLSECHTANHSENGQIVEIFESMAICTYLLNRYDVEHKLLFKSDPRYEAKYLQMSYFASGTVDNLTANSSPIQRVVTKYTGETTPGKSSNMMELNEKAFIEVVGPIMDQLMNNEESRCQKGYLYGSNEFGAIDAILAYNMVVLHKRKGWLSMYCNKEIGENESKEKSITPEHLKYTLLDYYKTKIVTRKSVQEAFGFTKEQLLEIINY